MYTQDNRNAQLTTSLGKDKLLLTQMDGTEGLSELFEFRVHAGSDQSDIDFKSLLGTVAQVEFEKGGSNHRYFNGHITEARWVGYDRLHRYELVLRPWLYYLTRASDSRIFKDKTVLEIIKQVFQDAGFTDFEDKTSGSYPTLHYTVQYFETHFEFVSRLMEKFGIYYFFKFENNKHKLVLSDGLSSHQANTVATAPFYPDPNATQREELHISSWITVGELRSGKSVFKDYNSETATSDLKAEHTEAAGHANDKHELYVYPGAYGARGDGTKLAKYRIEAERALTERRHASGVIAPLHPGSLFTLSNHPASSQNIEHLIIRANHVVNNNDYGIGYAEGVPYEGSYEFMPSSIQYRAMPLTRSAEIVGPQPAIVVGKKGEEIDVDEQGQILVHFYWDRYKTTSKRLRISQGVAGAKWGMQYTPRIGHEVLVGHLEGDPDKPFVMGSVYNSANKPPIAMPGDKTKSTWMSNSSKGGGGFNEIRYEDKKGSEEIWVHAQKDMNILVLNDKNVTVENDETLTITNNRTQKIEKGNETMEITKGDQKFDIKAGKRTTTIKGDDTFTLNSGSWKNTIKMGDWKNTVKMGDWSNKVSLGKMTTQAMSKIELKCMMSKITLEPTKITIKSLQVAVQATTTMDVKGLMTTVKGDAMLTLKGGMTMIN